MTQIMKTVVIVTTKPVPKLWHSGTIIEKVAVMTNY